MASLAFLTAFWAAGLPCTGGLDAPRLELPPWQPILGQYAFNITVREPAAQKYFNVGVMLLYNFNQANARAFFEAGLEVDPTCAMCAWGVAHSYGPNLNAPTKSVDELTAGFAAARHASVLLGAAHSHKETVLIEAMMLRYPEHPEQDDQVEAFKNYSARLKSIRAAEPKALGADPDVMVFDAEARMVIMCDSHGYHFYHSNGDDRPPTANKGTVEITALLQNAIRATNGSHPYAQHLIIHSTEMANAEASSIVPVARHLAEQMRPLQDQHLQHMSSHTFLRTGYYHEAVQSNIIAVSSDASYSHHGMVAYGPGHNCVFLVCAAMWGGERSNAYKYAQVCQKIFTGAPGRRDGPDGSSAWSYPMVAALRFGDWVSVEKLDVVPPGNFSVQWPYGYQVVRQFSLAVANVRLGSMTNAQKHLRLLRGQMPIVVATKNDVWKNLTAIANFTASAVVAHAHGDLSASVELLRQAVEIEMSMPYDEPPNWLLPSRECYGQAQMDAGRLDEAEKTFRASLYGYSFHAEPRCGWALFGLRATLQQQQQHHAKSQRAEEIKNLTGQISVVWQHSDVPLTSACLHLGLPGVRKEPLLV